METYPILHQWQTPSQQHINCVSCQRASSQPCVTWAWAQPIRRRQAQAGAGAVADGGWPDFSTDVHLLPLNGVLKALRREGGVGGGPRRIRYRRWVTTRRSRDPTQNKSIKIAFCSAYMLNVKINKQMDRCTRNPYYNKLKSTARPNKFLILQYNPRKKQQPWV